MKKNTAILAALVALGATGSAFAQTVPAALADLPGIEPVGEIAGLQAWTAENAQYLWLEGPTGELIAGFVFDETGKDIGAAAAGTPPTEFAVLTGELSPEEAAAGVSATLAVKPEDIGLEVPQTDTAAEGPIADVRVVENGETEVVLPSEAFDVAQEMLEGLPEAERAELLMALVTALRPVTTEDEFVAALKGWQDEVFARIGATATAPADDEAAPVAGEAEEAAVEPEEAAEAKDAVETPAAEAEIIPASAEDTEADLQEFFRETQEDTTWFVAGEKSAPVVYAYIDPTCPFCARAIDGLRGQIDKGELQLRVILAPLVSAKAPETIAGILLADNPVETFLEHETSIVKRTTSPVKLQDFKGLPAQVAAGIRKNYETVLKNGVPGVPFFAFQTEEGPKFFSGVPRGGEFDAALADGVSGSAN